MEGVITKGIAGFYSVAVSGQEYQCKARGIFRKDKTIPFVGDHVQIEPIDEYEAVITEIKPRRNQFIRPPIANVDCFVIVMAAKNPEPNLATLDKFTVMAEQKQTEVILCLNKIDLVDEEQIHRFTEIYEPLYPLVCLSAVTGEGILSLLEQIGQRTCSLAGPSGVGKSTILNQLTGRQLAQTGEISGKSQRGKHTTRHVELFSLEGGGLVFDTPGFSSFDVLEAEETELAHLYPEMVPLIGQCRYDDCRHLKEPDCMVRKALDEGKIKPSRYESYQAQMKEIMEKRKY